MSVNIRGAAEIEKKLNELYSSRKSSQIMNNAINKGAERVENNLRKEMEKHKDSGYTSDAVVRTNARNNVSGRVAQIGFSSYKGRASIVHLGEFGYSIKGLRVITPAFGAIQKVAEENKQDYLEIVRQEVMKLL